MAFRVEINGRLIECDTATEAVELAGLAERRRDEVIAEAAARINAITSPPPADRIAAFLNYIANAGNAGVAGTDLAIKLGMSDGRGLGGLVAGITGMLAKKGIPIGMPSSEPIHIAMLESPTDCPHDIMVICIICICCICCRPSIASAISSHAS